MSGGLSCHAFAEVNWSTYEAGLREGIRQEIHGLTKQYILGVEEQSYKAHLVDRYTLVPLEIIRESERITPRTEKSAFTDPFGRTGYRDIYVFDIQYPFVGSAGLLRVKPSSWRMTTYPISVDSSAQTVSFEVKVAQKNPEEFRSRKDEAFRGSFANIDNINGDASAWNASLANWIDTVFDARKKHYAAECDFFAAINVAPDPKTKAIFTVPTVSRKVIPRPEVRAGQQFSRNPTMSDEMYEDILNVLHQAGQAMERKPSLYRGKDEEDLRDQFLLFLETRYAGTTGTGETFNKSGKTDVLLKYEDGSNLFVAECKWWSGEADFHAAIKQLFDRYLTWRDSKAALLLFVANKNFTAVIEKVRHEATESPYFIRGARDRGETSLAFEFHLPDDKQRLVKFAILLFAFP